MSSVATAVVGGALISGYMGSQATQSAAATQANAANAASANQLAATQQSNAQQLSMYNQNVARQQPYVNAGTSALGQLTAGLAPGGQFSTNFTPSQLNMDPSYQFRLNQGTQNLNASAAARGMLGSGQNLKDITDYGQNAASQQYQQAFNNYQTQQTNLYNRVSGIATLGQNAATGVGSAGIQTGANMANTTMAGAAASNNYLTGGAAASAAGTVGQANAVSGAINTGLGNWMNVQQIQNQQSYLNNMNGGGTATPTNMSGFSTPTAATTYPTTAPTMGSGLVLLD